MAKKIPEEPIPKKRDPGDRARQRLSAKDVEKLTRFASRAAKLKKVPPSARRRSPSSRFRTHRE